MEVSSRRDQLKRVWWLEQVVATPVGAWWSPVARRWPMVVSRSKQAARNDETLMSRVASSAPSCSPSKRPLAGASRLRPWRHSLTATTTSPSCLVAKWTAADGKCSDVVVLVYFGPPRQGQLIFRQIRSRPTAMLTHSAGQSKRGRVAQRALFAFRFKGARRPWISWQQNLASHWLARTRQVASKLAARCFSEQTLEVGNQIT